MMFVFLCNACSFPKDPNNSFENAKKSSLLIGIIPNTDSITTSFEKNLVEDFAKEEGMQIQSSDDQSLRRQARSFYSTGRKPTAFSARKIHNPK